MIDLFTTLHSSDLGTLAIDYAHDPSVVGPNDPPRPTKLVPTLYLDVVGPDLPPRPK